MKSHTTHDERHQARTLINLRMSTSWHLHHLAIAVIPALVFLKTTPKQMMAGLVTRLPIHGREDNMALLTKEVLIPVPLPLPNMALLLLHLTKCNNIPLPDELIKVRRRGGEGGGAAPPTRSHLRL
jgi:hypothetical protein